MTVRDVDRGYSKLLARVGAMAKTVSVTVGIHEDEGSKEHHAGMSVADLGTIHELGLGVVPERSFVRAFVDDEEEAIGKRMVDAGKSAVAGSVEVAEAMDDLGAWAGTRMKDRIRDGIGPPDEDGSPTPLVESGKLVSAISHRVRT